MGFVNIQSTVTQETYNKLKKIAEEENKHIAKVIEKIIVKETKTITRDEAMKIYKETH